MSEELEAISAAACMDVIARGEETINPKFAGVVRDLIDRLRLEASSSQARLSEAVEVLEEAIPLLDDAADKLEAEGMWGTSERDMAIRARQFLAILREEK